jgi:hypothetical protein
VGPLCLHIAAILTDEELMRITDGNPDPVGECSEEAAEIARQVITALGGRQLVGQSLMASVVSDVFKREFEVEIGSDEAACIARRIEAVID